MIVKRGKKLKPLPKFCCLGEERFEDRSPSYFCVEDFYELDQLNNYVIRTTYDRNRRCGNIFFETNEVLQPSYFYVTEEGQMIVVRIVDCKAFRFLTMCKLFIHYQIEYQVLRQGKGIFKLTEEGEEVIDGFELQVRFKIALETVISDKILLDRILYFEKLGYKMTRIDWMSIFAYSVIKKEYVYHILGIDKDGNEFFRLGEKILCNICKSPNGLRYGAMLKEEGDYIITESCDILARVWDPDTHMRPYWTLDHNCQNISDEGGLFHHMTGKKEHFHYRVELSRGMKTFTVGNLDVSLTLRELVIIRICTLIVKRNINKDFRFGLQYYCLYPVDKLFEDFDDDVGCAIVAWMTIVWNDRTINLHNSDDSLFSHFIMFFGMVSGNKEYKIVGVDKLFTDEKIQSMKDTFKNLQEGEVYINEEGRKTFRQLKDLWLQFKDELIVKLKLYGCNCNLCSNKNFPSL